MAEKQNFEFTIESGKTERHYWMNLWRYRELFYILAWRDIAVRYKQTIIAFVVQLGLYISPVGFSTTIVPEKYQLLYYLNPVVAVIDGFRWAISGGKMAFNMTELSVSIVMIIILSVLGVYHFRKTEKTFADVI